MLSMRFGNLQFQSARLPASVRTGVRSATVRTGTVHFVVREHLGLHVSQWNENHALMAGKVQNGHGDSLLSSALRSDRGKDTGRFAYQGTGLPQTTTAIQESFHLSRHLSKTTRKTKNNAVVLGQLVGSDNRIGLKSGIQFCERMKC